MHFFHNQKSTIYSKRLYELSFLLQFSVLIFGLQTLILIKFLYFSFGYKSVPYIIPLTSPLRLIPKLSEFSRLPVVSFVQNEITAAPPKKERLSKGVKWDQQTLLLVFFHLHSTNPRFTNNAEIITFHLKQHFFVFNIFCTHKNLSFFPFLSHVILSCFLPSLFKNKLQGTQSFLSQASSIKSHYSLVFQTKVKVFTEFQSFLLSIFSIKEQIKPVTRHFLHWSSHYSY